MWQSHRIGTLDIDKGRAVSDLERMEPGGYLDSYTEFVCGSWRTCMLWNASGDGADSRLHDYAGRAQLTEYGRKLGYLDELISEHFHLENLRFARLARLGPGSVVVPHRDYLELDDELTRIHIPLETDEDVFTSEQETVYRMRFGEVWFLDATKIHSIGSFSAHNRTHLILDFPATEPSSVVRIGEPEPESLPAESIVPRRPLEPGEKDAFLALSKIIDPASFRDVMAMIIRRYFAAEIDAAEVFTWLRDIAAASGREDVAAQARWIAQHAIDAR